MRPRILLSIFPFLLALTLTTAQDDLNLTAGFTTLRTAHFEAVLGNASQILTSLKPLNNPFDFLPSDYLDRRARNGQYHWGDVTFRYRAEGSEAWIEGDSAAARATVTNGESSSEGVLASANLGPTLGDSEKGLNVTREWVDVSGDLGLRFTIGNSGDTAVEIGSLGFPVEVNSIFTERTAEEIQEKCSLVDPYIGMHAGYLRVSPVSGKGIALVVTSMGDTPLEAWRNLPEASYEGTYYGSQIFEGFYEWQVLSKAWAENEWRGKEPWNLASSVILQPGEEKTFGLRFSLAEGIRDIGTAVRNTETPFAAGVPGYIIPRDLPAQLQLYSQAAVSSIDVSPQAAFTVSQTAQGKYTLTPSPSAFGRARVTITYTDAKVQTVHYYITKSGPEALQDLGTFSTTAQWFNDTSDPFGRAPSVMTYDYEASAIVTQDDRAWIAGLSDEAGAGSYLAATMKQAASPNAGEIAKLEDFVAKVLFKTIQTEDFAVRKSAFFYEPDAVPGYAYRTDLNFAGTWNKEAAYLLDRAYNYVHVAAAYWALYRVGRAYPDLLRQQDWEWYLNQAYQTVMACVAVDENGNPTVGYSQVGLMGETVFGELLTDLKREDMGDQADALEAKMKVRAVKWNGEAVPFGSEMAWDSTGQEGVYCWTKYFGFNATAEKALNTVLGFQPTVAHWGWNGNARRYWDNIYGGKLRRIERQIHHYGSGLNALVLLSEFRSNPADPYLLHAGYGGMNGPLSNIHNDGFAAASFHSWPDTLEWDGYSGDYGPNFVGLILGSGTYVVQDEDAGLVAFGGELEKNNDEVTVRPRDAVRRKVFVGPLGVLVSVDAGVIRELTYRADANEVEVTVSQLDGLPKASAAVLWIETTVGDAKWTVTSPGLEQVRMGWRVPLDGGDAVVKLGTS